MHLKASFITLIILFLACTNLFSQDTIDVNKKDSNEKFLKILSNSKDNLYQNILNKYDSYIVNNPTDIQVKVERCKFIGNAYYDEYEDYNYKYDEHQECINNLYKSYSNHSSVLVYKAQNTYGDSLQIILDDAENKIINKLDNWDPYDIAAIYEMQAYQYEEDNPRKVIEYVNKAQKSNDSLDLSILLAKAFKKEGNKNLVISSLNSKIDNESEPWKLKQKADLFLEIGELEKALELYERLNEKDSSYVVNSDLSKVFYEKGDYETARVYLIKDTINEWNKNSSIQDLLNFDIKHSSGITALATYNRMQELSYYDDLVGIKRLRIFFSDPFLKISINDLSHILVFLLAVVILFLLPYLWILPIFGIGSFLKKKGKVIHVKLPFNWTLKHFWLYSFLYLLVSFIVIIIFNYQETINYYFDVVSYYSYEEESDEITSASSVVLFMLLMALSAFVVVRKNNFKYLYTSKFKIKKLIVFGIVFVIFNGIVLSIYKSIFGSFESSNLFTIFSIREAIISVINEYGIVVTFLLVVIIVPIYEEIVFRGIILSSTEKYIGFNSANAIQAMFFALVHDSLFLFPFYFLFGLICGMMAKKSGGLLGNIILHSINNSFAVLSIYYLMHLTKATLGI